MTKRSFIENCLRELGFNPIKYKTICGQETRVVTQEKGLVRIFSDMSTWDRSHRYVKFNIEGLNESEVISFSRKLRAFLLERGFSANVDYYYSSRKHYHIVRIGTLNDWPWNQCIKNFTVQQMEEDAFRDQIRYKGVGNMFS